jgi:hypothetical protein
VISLHIIKPQQHLKINCDISKEYKRCCYFYSSFFSFFFLPAKPKRKLLQDKILEPVMVQKYPEKDFYHFNTIVL